VSCIIFEFYRESNGSLPEGFTSPEITEAMALPASVPQYQPSTIDGTSFTHGIATALPVISITTTFLLAFTRALISLS